MINGMTAKTKKNRCIPPPRPPVSDPFPLSNTPAKMVWTQCHTASPHRRAWSLSTPHSPLPPAAPPSAAPPRQPNRRLPTVSPTVRSRRRRPRGCGYRTSTLRRRLFDWQRAAEGATVPPAPRGVLRPRLARPRPKSYKKVRISGGRGVYEGAKSEAGRRGVTEDSVRADSPQGQTESKTRHVARRGARVVEQCSEKRVYGGKTHKISSYVV